MFSYAAVFEDLVVRAGLALPALGVLDPGDGAPDSAMEKGNPRRLLRIRCDARDQRVQMDVTGPAEVESPDHLVTAQTALLQHDREHLLDLADCRLLARPPGQDHVLDRSAGAGRPHRGSDHLTDLT